MTISSETREVGPFTGNGSTTAFPFTFKVIAASDLSVVRTNATTGVSTTLALTADYTVTLNADQNNSAGGTVTLLSALATGFTLMISSAASYLQPTNLTNGGGFYPTVINDALDRLTIFVQQMLRTINRGIRIPSSESATATNLILPIASLRVNKAIVFDSSGNVGVSTDDYVNQATNAAASASAASSSATSASTSASSALTYLNNFKGQYYGPLSADPTLDPLGAAIGIGDLYWNTTVPEMRVYNGSAWVAAYVSSGVYLLLTGGTLTGGLTGTTFNGTTFTGTSFTGALNGAHNGSVGATTPSTGKFLYAYSPEITLTDGASIAWDASTGQVAKVTLGGNRTFAAPTNLVTGSFYSILVVQDGTGSRTATWNSVFAFTGGTAPTLTTTASAVDQIAFRYDGTKLREVGRSLGIA